MIRIDKAYGLIVAEQFLQLLEINMNYEHHHDAVITVLALKHENEGLSLTCLDEAHVLPVFQAAVTNYDHELSITVGQPCGFDVDYLNAIDPLFTPDMDGDVESKTLMVNAAFEVGDGQMPAFEFFFHPRDIGLAVEMVSSLFRHGKLPDNFDWSIHQ